MSLKLMPTISLIQNFEKAILEHDVELKRQCTAELFDRSVEAMVQRGGLTLVNLTPIKSAEEIIEDYYKAIERWGGELCPRCGSQDVQTNNDRICSECGNVYEKGE